MLKRLLVGLILGTVIGAVVAAVLVQGLGLVSFAGSGGVVFAYLAAAATGVITGLVAGKPIWAADGKIEAGLKAFFGGLLALGGMFVLRQWVHADLNLTSMNAGHAEIGWLPAASLPLIAGVLASFFELDNSGEAAKKEDAKKDAKASGKQVRVAKDAEAEDEEEEEEAAPAKKRR